MLNAVLNLGSAALGGGSQHLSSANLSDIWLAPGMSPHQAARMFNKLIAAGLC